MNALRPKTALKIAALLGIFNAAAATAQAPAYLVINNTDQTLTCSTRVPNGLWQDWFEIPPGANWVGPRGAAELQFQCRPPVAQLSYSLRPEQRNSLLSSGPEIRLVEIVQGH